jgi:hypothetical protein
MMSQREFELLLLRYGSEKKFAGEYEADQARHLILAEVNKLRAQIWKLTWEHAECTRERHR